MAICTSVCLAYWGACVATFVTCWLLVEEVMPAQSHDELVYRSTRALAKGVCNTALDTMRLAEYKLQVEPNDVDFDKTMIVRYERLKQLRDHVTQTCQESDTPSGWCEHASRLPGSLKLCVASVERRLCRLRPHRADTYRCPRNSTFVGYYAWPFIDRVSDYSFFLWEYLWFICSFFAALLITRVPRLV